jgi:hypothetical protein
MRPLASTAARDLSDVIDDRRRLPDRRNSPRKRILWGALAGWQNGDSTECIVHNLSETGAQLQIRGPVPKTFNLVVDGDRMSRACCVVWRSANRIGVKFEGQAEIAGLVSSFKQYASQCRMLAEAAASVDRETLLKMAAAWEALVRRSQRKPRLVGQMSY